MECVQIKEKDFLKKLISLDLDEGIRIEGRSQTKIFINRNACDNFVVQFVDNTDTPNSSSNHNIKYFYSAAEVFKFVKSTFDKHFSIWLY
ncbi:MAG: hypothetical protein WA667_11515 [Candidatus Nitrosopolaris sp.]